MTSPSPSSRRLRAVLDRERTNIAAVLDRYGATNVRLFGSAARGDADDRSDIDLLVDLTPGGGNELLRVAGLAEELSVILNAKVDVVTNQLLRDEVRVTALTDVVGM